MQTYDLTIVGAGPAGMMAAIQASQKSQRLVLLERNSQAGKKLLLTGKGRCNFTNNKTVPEIIEAFGPKAKFLYRALTQFSNQALIDWFNRRGVITKVERGQRVFPLSDKAETLLNCLLRELRKRKVKLVLGCKVKSVKLVSSGFVLTSDRGEKLKTTKLILATGGLSYSQTGSTGDGYRWAKQLGHDLIPPRPALVGLVVKDNLIRSLAGLSLKNVNLSFSTKAGLVSQAFGEMLFTHQGISGPIVLSQSKLVRQALDRQGQVWARIDLKPALTKEQLKKRVFREIHQAPKQHLPKLLKQLLPLSLIEPVIEWLHLDVTMANADLATATVKTLINWLKDFSFKIDAVEPIARAIITDGGVRVEEIDSRTMESKLVPGLFFAGEIIALAGPTGGYNLQKAFSTGYLAGSSA